MDVDFVVAVEDILDEPRRNERHAFTIRDNKIAGHYGDTNDADG
jgi:hypothetical protein